MQFRTQIPIPKSSFPINYDSKVLSLGSCFAVNMAEKLEYFKFQNTVNPFGILFHPLAIDKLIDSAVNNRRFRDEDVFFHNERWHCFDAHSDLSDSNKETLLDNLNSATASIRKQLSQTTHLIITYGTAWVYREKKSENVISNCHKLPQNQFAKEILSVETIRETIRNTIGMIRNLNPNVQIIFTISPVRHIKDGFTENQWSKSNLISGLQSAMLTSENTTYFPSYEIMMDELRDYRFYADDMIHPNPTAIDYIWKRFAETTISESAVPIMEQIQAIRKKMAHRPFHQDSESHKNFQVKLAESIDEIQKQYPHLQF